MRVGGEGFVGGVRWWGVMGGVRGVRVRGVGSWGPWEGQSRRERRGGGSGPFGRTVAGGF